MSIAKKTDLKSRFYRPFNNGADCFEVSSVIMDNKLQILLSNSSEHTIYNLEIRITDYQSRSDLIAERPDTQNAFGSVRIFNPCDITITIKRFNKHSTVVLASLSELYARRHTLKVHTILTHGNFIKYQEFSHVGDHQWVSAEKVVNKTPDQIPLSSVFKQASR